MKRFAGACVTEIQCGSKKRELDSISSGELPTNAGLSSGCKALVDMPRGLEQDAA
jgi:hypothetical protein